MPEYKASMDIISEKAQVPKIQEELNAIKLSGAKILIEKIESNSIKNELNEENAHIKMTRRFTPVQSKLEDISKVSIVNPSYQDDKEKHVDIWCTKISWWIF